jgi:hypothetical protein
VDDRSQAFGAWINIMDFQRIHQQYMRCIWLLGVPAGGGASAEARWQCNDNSFPSIVLYEN